MQHGGHITKDLLGPRGVPVGGGGGAAAPTATFTVITTGAQTLEIDGLDFSAETLVEWGDGSGDLLSGAGVRTHNYAGAGTWTLTIHNPENVTKFSLDDAKLAVSGVGMGAMTNLTYLRLNNATVLWTVSDDAPMPSGITDLTLYAVAITWNVGSVAGANMPAGLTALQIFNCDNITWNVGSVAGANMPTLITSLSLSFSSGITWAIGSVAGANIPPDCVSLTVAANAATTVDPSTVFPATLTTLRIENSLSQAQVDLVLAKLYAAFPTRTGTNGTVDLLGTSNAAPTGVSPGAAECPPTTGWNTAYELVNDSCGVSSKHWASVTCQT